MSLNCDDDRYLPRQGLHLTTGAISDFAELLVPCVTIQAVRASTGRFSGVEARLRPLDSKTAYSLGEL